MVGLTSEERSPNMYLPRDGEGWWLSGMDGGGGVWFVVLCGVCGVWCVVCVVCGVHGVWCVVCGMRGVWCVWCVWFGVWLQ